MVIRTEFSLLIVVTAQVTRDREPSDHPLEGRLSRSRNFQTTNLNAWSLTRRKFALGEECRCAAPPDATLSSESKADHEQAAAILRRLVSLRTFLIQTLAGLKIGFSVRRLGIWTTATIVLSLAVAGVASYAACSDGYRFETKLLLFDRDHIPTIPQAGPLRKK